MKTHNHDLSDLGYEIEKLYANVSAESLYEALLGAIGNHIRKNPMSLRAPDKVVAEWFKDSKEEVISIIDKVLLDRAKLVRKASDALYECVDLYEHLREYRRLALVYETFFTDAENTLEHRSVVAKKLYDSIAEDGEDRSKVIAAGYIVTAVLGGKDLDFAKMPEEIRERLKTFFEI